MNTKGIRYLQWPWQRNKRDTDPETRYILAKSNYNVYTTIGINTRTVRRFETVLDTRAVSSFIMFDVLTNRLRDKTEKVGDYVTIRNASGKPAY